MNQINEILLRRKHLIMLDKNSTAHEATEKEIAMVLTIAKNIESLGFTFSKEVIEILLTYPQEELKAFYLDFMPKLKVLVGADKEYIPMYPNFPEQVVEASGLELYLNAVFHYWTWGQWKPEYKKEERLPLFDSTDLIVLKVGTKADLMELFTNLVSSKTNISGQDKADLAMIIEENADYQVYLPEVIPLKENVAFVSHIILEKAAVKNSAVIEKYFKTATDVLRLITAMSYGDISLKEKTKYRHFKRPERRVIMDLLAGCGNLTEDMYRYQYEWIRIGEIIHPGEFSAEKYSRVNKVFSLLRSDKKPRMFAAELQTFLDWGFTYRATCMLEQRPGEFARRLDKLLRDSDDEDLEYGTRYVLKRFAAVADQVSTPVLLQVRQHFIGRVEELEKIRAFFPKGNIAKAMIIPNELPEIDKDICREVIKICEDALLRIYSKREPLGKVYVDEALKECLVPFSQRNASGASKIVVRGSRLPIKKDASAIRAFIWWTNTEDDEEDDRDAYYYNRHGRVDIDLSASLFNENWEYMEHISYTRLCSDRIKAYHSGDITDGGPKSGNGAAEFLDVDIDAAAKKGRYIVYQIFSYTMQPFKQLPNCRFGWMEREDVNSGEIFEPATVEMSMDVTADSTVAIPVIFDCWERKVLWCDMNLGLEHQYSYIGNNVESRLKKVNVTCYAMSHLNKANMFDLITLNAKARGTIVADPAEADIIFSNEIVLADEIGENQKADEETMEVAEHAEQENTAKKVITAFDIDYFMAELL